MVCTCDHTCSTGNPCGFCSTGSCACGTDCRCGASATLGSATLQGGNACVCGKACGCTQSPVNGNFVCQCTRSDCTTCSTCLTQRASVGMGGTTL
ncbi:hypothetical protein KP509_08G066000 [Ceratopteris richardii]|uniref:Uncharacterized protein n=1 Tax=Ceratopteris richardii TaxID=49495 RepID=A0A8T2UD18_CERRI|nr:hypothetical protein KP509_08G066000 [Ceratopteris richardii]